MSLRCKVASGVAAPLLCAELAQACSLQAASTLLRAILRCQRARATRRYPLSWHSESRRAEIRGRTALQAVRRVSSGGAVVFDTERQERELPPIWLWEHCSSPDVSPDSREVPEQFFNLVKEATRDRLWAERGLNLA